MTTRPALRIAATALALALQLALVAGCHVPASRNTSYRTRLHADPELHLPEIADGSRVQPLAIADLGDMSGYFGTQKAHMAIVAALEVAGYRVVEADAQIAGTIPLTAAIGYEEVAPSLLGANFSPTYVNASWVNLGVGGQECSGLRIGPSHLKNANDALLRRYERLNQYQQFILSALDAISQLQKSSMLPVPSDGSRVGSKEMLRLLDNFVEWP